MGQNASATAEGAVAIGQDSVADEANTVSIGSAGNERRLTQVATGIRDTDAANVGQVKDASQQTLRSAKDYTDARFNAMDDRFSEVTREIGQRLGRQDRRIDRQGR